MSVRGQNFRKGARGTARRVWLMECARSVRSHILQSEGPERERFEQALELPQVPEMVFAGNELVLKHKDGFGIFFNALDALKLVDAHGDPLKVAVAKTWSEARAECEHIQNTVKPFDWTFTTDYKGTLIHEPGAAWKVSQTEDRIDIEKLKQRERICFYEDVMLFEDELSDNGSSILSVKIRVMPTSFFILMRFFMRVDQVMLRISDTRIYHESGWNYLLREFTTRDETVDKLKVPPHIMTDANEISQHLPIECRNTRNWNSLMEKHSLQHTAVSLKQCSDVDCESCAAVGYIYRACVHDAGFLCEPY